MNHGNGETVTQVSSYVNLNFDAVSSHRIKYSHTASPAVECKQNTLKIRTEEWLSTETTGQAVYGHAEAKLIQVTIVITTDQLHEELSRGR